MIQRTNRLGVYGLPGTFPTDVIQSFMWENYGPGALPWTEGFFWTDAGRAFDRRWSRDKINDMYRDYVSLVESGIAPWPQGMAKLTAGMIAEGWTKADSILFLDALEKSVKAGTIKKDYLLEPSEGPTIETAKKIVKAPGKILEAGTDAIAKSAGAIKWVSIAALIGVTLYFSWPLLQKARRKFNKKRITA